MTICQHPLNLMRATVRQSVSVSLRQAQCKLTALSAHGAPLMNLPKEVEELLRRW